MGRDRGRGKGGGRGGRGTGKKMYIDNVEELEKRNRQDHDDEDEEEEEEEEGTKGPGETVFGFQRAAKPAAGTDGDDAAQMMGSLSINNPNRAVGADGTAEVGMNRKERYVFAILTVWAAIILFVLV